MLFKREHVRIGSIIEANNHRFKVTNPDSDNGALCVRFIKSRKTWAKTGGWFEYNKNYTFMNIIY